MKQLSLKIESCDECPCYVEYYTPMCERQRSRASSYNGYSTKDDLFKSCPLPDANEEKENGDE